VKKKAGKKPLNKSDGDGYYDNREEEFSGKHNDIFRLMELVSGEISTYKYTPIPAKRGRGL
jgi:hypothetical protein